VIALPALRGPEIGGLPHDALGYLPVDEFGVVQDVEDVYAAGDGTTFPVKQGGLATQQADAVAEHIAARVGALTHPEPFHPVLRGQLLTGGESLNMRHDLRGEDRGDAGPDYLWWPPQKVAGRYLAAWLGHADATQLSGPVDRALDIEVSVPHEWHSEPL
jgi:sulfide:quinone oxidoreductase